MSAPETTELTPDAGTIVATGSNAGRVWFPQAMRGVACLIVVVMHLGDTYPLHPNLVAKIGSFDPISSVPNTPWAGLMRFTHDPLRFSVGDVAVATFFLVSGFVIPFSLRRSSVAEFTAKRVLRLYPTLAACLLVLIGAMWLQHTYEGRPMPYGTRDVVLNMSLLAPYFHVGWIEPAAWTLAVEELFYVTAAVLVWRRAYGSRLVLVTIGVVVAVLALVPADTGAAYWWFTLYLSFVPFVFVGTVLHHVYEGEWSPRDALLIGGALFASFVIAMYAGPDGYQATEFTRSALLAVGIFAGFTWFGRELPYSRAFDALSKITYPLYLLHAVSGWILMHWLQIHGVGFYVALGLAIGYAVIAAIVVHVVVEEPAVKVGRRIARTIAQRRASRVTTTPVG